MHSRPAPMSHLVCSTFLASVGIGLLILTLCFSAARSTRAQQQTPWQTYTSSDGRLRFEHPSSARIVDVHQNQIDGMRVVDISFDTCTAADTDTAGCLQANIGIREIRHADAAALINIETGLLASQGYTSQSATLNGASATRYLQGASAPPRREVWYMRGEDSVLRVDLQVLAASDPTPYQAVLERVTATLALTPAPRRQIYLPLVHRAGTAAASTNARAARPQFASTIPSYNRDAVLSYLNLFTLWKINDDWAYFGGFDSAHFIARAISSGGATIPPDLFYQNTIVGLRHYILANGYGEIISEPSELQIGDLILTHNGMCYGWGGVVHTPGPVPIVSVHSPEGFVFYPLMDASFCGPATGFEFIRMGSNEVGSGMDLAKDFYHHGNRSGNPDTAFLGEFNTSQISYTLSVEEVTQVVRGTQFFSLPLSLISDTSILTLPHIIRGGTIEVAKPVEHSFRQRIYRKVFPTSITFVQTALAAGQCFGRSATAAAFYARASHLQDYDSDAQYIVEADETKQLLQFIDVYQGRQTGDTIQEWLHESAWKTPLDLTNSIITQMSLGLWKANPYVIGIYTSANCDDIKVGHALLPYKVVLQSAAEYRIYVFDPNYPLLSNQSALNKYISVNRSNNTWSYEFAPGIFWSGSSLTFIPLNKFTERTRYAGDSKAVISLSGTRGRDRSLAGGDKGGSCISLSNPITVSQILSVTNIFHQIIPYGGDIAEFPYALYAPGDAVAGRDLDFYFNEERPETTPRADNSVIGPDTVIGFYGTLGQRATNALHIRKDFRSFSLRTSLDQQIVSPYLSRRDEPGRFTLFYGLSNVPLRRGEALTVTTTGNSVEIVNQGPAKSFSLGVAYIGDHGLSRYSRQISAPANSRVVIAAWDWSRLDSTTIFAYTDSGNDGSFEQELLLQDARPTAARVAPLSYTAADGTIYFVPVQARLALPVAPATCCVAATRYRLDSGSWMTYTLPVALELPDGPHRIDFFSHDTVSNTERLNTRGLLAYREPPTTTVTLDGPRLPDGSYTEQVTVTLRATSYLSDAVRVAPHTTYYRLNGGERRVYQGPVGLSSAGLSTFEFWSVDAAGYTERSKRLDLRVQRRLLSLVPLDRSQSRLEEAYRAAFGQLQSGVAVERLSGDTLAAGQVFRSGTLALEDRPGGVFSRTELLSSELVLSPTLPLRAPRVALIAAPQSWELGSFSAVLDGLFGLEHVAVLTATQVTTAALADIDVAVVPSVGVGETPALISDLGAAGQAALRWFGQQPGRTLYLQGQSTLLLPWLDPTLSSTVAPAEQVSAPGSQAQILVADPRHPLTVNLVTSSLALAHDPLLSAGAGLSALLTFSDTDHPGAPALLAGPWGRGQLVLLAGHPTLRPGDRQYPLLANLLLTAAQEPLRLSGSLRQEYSGQMPDDTLPYERGAAATVTRRLLHSNPLAVSDLVLTDTLDPAFALGRVAPAPTRILSSTVLRDGRLYPRTALVWELAPAGGAQTLISYTVRISAPELLGPAQTVATAELGYRTPADGRGYASGPQPLTARLVRPAVLTGTLAAGQADVYPLTRDGLIAEQTVAMRNTEGSAASGTQIQALVPLLTPAFDLASGSAALDRASGTLPLFSNTVQFSEQTGRSPLPDGVTDWRRSLGLDDWDGTTVYTISVPVADLRLSGPPDLLCEPFRSVRFPPSNPLSDAVRLIPDGAVTHVVLPALRLTWSYGSLPGFEFQNPALRFTVRTAEQFGRSASLRGAPEPQSLVLDSEAVAFLTHLGSGRSPYRLRPEWRAPPVQAGPQGSVAYTDVWARPQVFDLPQSYSTLLIPAGYHAGPGQPTLWSSFSYLLKADRDGDGSFETLTPEFNFADRTALLEGTITISGTGAAQQSVVSLLSLFRGQGWRLEPLGGSWPQALQPQVGGAELIGVGGDGIYDTLMLRVRPEQGRARIGLRAYVRAEERRVEGPLKLTDGLVTTYREPHGSDTRLEFYRSAAVVPWGLESGLSIKSSLSTSQVRTLDDTLYHTLELSDPRDPRDLTDPRLPALAAADQYLKTVAGPRHMASVFVGGRLASQSYQALLEPGGLTVVRYYVVNTGAAPLTDVAVTPLSPTAGLLVEPLDISAAGGVFDLPDLNRRTILPGQQGVYVFRVQVAPALPAGMPGGVVPLDFRLTAGGQTLEPLPPAQIGLRDGQGHVLTSYGPATPLTLTETFSPLATPLEARVASGAEYTAFRAALSSGRSQADAIFSGLRSIPYSLRPGAAPLQSVQIGLQQLGQFPRSDAGALERWYVIFKTRVRAPAPGQYTLMDAPTVEFRDFQSVPRRTGGPAATAVASGAAMDIRFDRGSQISLADGRVVGDFFYGVTGDVTTTLNLRNGGRTLIEQPVITLTLAPEVEVLGAALPGVALSGRQLVWRPGSLAPGADGWVRLALKLRVFAPAGPANRPRPLDLITAADFALRDLQPTDNGPLSWRVDQPLGPPYQIRPWLIWPD